MPQGGPAWLAATVRVAALLLQAAAGPPVLELKVAAEWLEFLVMVSGVASLSGHRNPICHPKPDHFGRLPYGLEFARALRPLRREKFAGAPNH